jgi:hypothetical protein
MWRGDRGDSEEKPQRNSLKNNAFFSYLLVLCHVQNSGRWLVPKTWLVNNQRWLVTGLSPLQPLLGVGELLESLRGPWMGVFVRMHLPGSRLLKTRTVITRVVDPDWIRIQSGLWIRIQEGKNDPQK